MFRGTIEFVSHYLEDLQKSGSEVFSDAERNILTVEVMKLARYLVQV
jgi:hypothetical protein